MGEQTLAHRRKTFLRNTLGVRPNATLSRVWWTAKEGNNFFTKTITFARM